MRKVTVVYHNEDDAWWAESPDEDLSTFVATGTTLEEVRELTREGVTFYLDTEDVQIVERFDQERPVLLGFLLESAVGIADALTVSAGSSRRSSLAPAQPHIVIG
ncbi:type II toxin-antitoxin system HicB family antitoxin [Nonomuraea sp. NPDC004702]